jgi:hypothetical protein
LSFDELFADAVRYYFVSSTCWRMSFLYFGLGEEMIELFHPVLENLK